MHLHELETPVAVIDLDKMEANIIRLQHYLDEHAIVNRPHIKTHKIPHIAHMQLNAGAIGITCQKLGEAEIMAQAGCHDIFITFNMLGSSRLDRLAALARWTTLSVTADSEVVIQGLSQRFQSEAMPLSVLVECDTGGKRCGAQSPQQAAELARLIERLPGLHFGGLMTYPCSEHTDAFMLQTKQLLAADKIAVERVSGGGTPRMWQAHSWKEITEYRVGTYVYGDRKCVQVAVMSYEQCAMTVMCSVVSRPTAERGILDAGSKTLSSDLSGLEGYGYILEYPEAVIYMLNEEHGYVDFSACSHKPIVGERVTLIPNHCCVVSNMFNNMIGVRGEHVEIVWPVAARGMLT